ncbi:MAG: cytochrome c [Nitrospirae bacterium]|nr:cytochrome c [Nitrospirota bacterium]
MNDFLIRLFLLIFIIIAPVSSQALPWSKDMFNQPSIKPQETAPLPVPPGTVNSKGMEKEIKNRSGAANIINPVKPDDASIARGQAMYNIYCIVCHGKTGKGDGIVGKKFVPPTDLSGSYVQMKPDGDIYFTIRYGGLAVMPRYGDAIPPADRWHIINYIKGRLSE